MRHFLILPIILLGLLQIQAQEGIDFFKGTWEEALAEAQIQEKIIFVDAYAVWCGPCKRMAKDVFTRKDVGDFYNKNFINLKIDMERGMGLTFRRTFPVSAFPTLMYIDANGKMVHQVKGGKQPDAFIKLGKFALSKVDYSQQYVEAYENGDRSPELVLNYVKALNKAGKSSLHVSNEYIRGQKDLTTEQNLKFLLEAATEADSRIFDLMIQHKSEIEQLVSEQAVKDKIEKACYRTAEKAIEFQSTELHQLALDKMKKHTFPKKQAPLL